MIANKKCPKCGSNHTQLSNEEHRHHSIFYWIFLGWWLFLVEVLIRLMIGCFLFFCIDWWMAIVRKAQHRGYVWQCHRWFSTRKRIWYCHDCGSNFRD